MKRLSFFLALLLGMVVLVACPRGTVTGPLAAPGSLQATPGSGQIVLTWQDNSTAEEGFRIYRKLEAETEFSGDPLATTLPDADTYTDTSVSAADTYVYQVRAFAGASEGELSPASNPAKPILAENKATLEVITEGDRAQGVVTSDPTGIDCIQRPGVTGDCSFDFDKGTSVTLTATPDLGSQFTGWSGDCNGQTCVITLDASKTATATFTPIANRLLVTKRGDGDGLVTSDTTDEYRIDCGTKCEASSEVITRYGLRGQATSGSIFAGWNLETCTDRTKRCFVTIGNGQGAEVIATFLRDRPDPTIEEFTVTPNPMLPSTTEVTVSWRVDDKGSTEPTTLELEDDFQSYNLEGKGLEDSIVVPVSTNSRTFRLTVENIFSENRDSPPITREVTVTRGEAPTITNFAASAPSITAGQSVTLSWDALPAGTTLQLEKNPANGPITTVPASGTGATDSPTVTTTYTLIATNTFGTTRSNAVAVTVGNVPSITFASSPAASSGVVSVVVNTPVTLSWTVTGAAANGVTLNGATVASVSNFDATPTAVGSTTYTLAATNTFGAATPQTITVTGTAVPIPSPDITSFTAPGAPEDTSYAVGVIIPLSWVITNQSTLSELTLRRVSPSPEVSIPITPPITTTPAADVTLEPTPGTAIYRLVATNAPGATGFDAENKSITTGAKPVITNVQVSTPGVIPPLEYSVSWDITADGAISYELLDPSGVAVPGLTITASPFTFTPAVSGNYTLRASNEFGDTANAPGTGDGTVPIP